MIYLFLCFLGAGSSGGGDLFSLSLRDSLTGGVPGLGLEPKSFTLTSLTAGTGESERDTAAVVHLDDFLTGGVLGRELEPESFSPSLTAGAGESERDEDLEDFLVATLVSSEGEEHEVLEADLKTEQILSSAFESSSAFVLSSVLSSAFILP